MANNIKNMGGCLDTPVTSRILIGLKIVNICKAILEIMRSFIVSDLGAY